MQLNDVYLERFLSDLQVVEKEVKLLSSSQSRMFGHGVISRDWVSQLEGDEAKADMVEAFLARFSRMQDSIGGKLIPHLLLLEGEDPGSLLDNINRMEKRALLPSARNWVNMRQLRNKLVHEYVEDEDEFASSLNTANKYIDELIQIFRNIKRYAKNNLELDV